MVYTIIRCGAIRRQIISVVSVCIGTGNGLGTIDKRIIMNGAPIIAGGDIDTHVGRAQEIKNKVVSYYGPGTGNVDSSLPASGGSGTLNDIFMEFEICTIGIDTVTVTAGMVRFVYLQTYDFNVVI